MNVSSIMLAGQKLQKQEARECMASGYDLKGRSASSADIFRLLESTTVAMLDRKVKHGENLTFEEAFCGMCYVLAATNAHFYSAYRSAIERAYGIDSTNVSGNLAAGFTPQKALAIASAFLNLMAAKEALSTLTSEEIAGMVAAAMNDTVVSLDLFQVIETCGMGGDKGFERNGRTKKSINVSTLSSLVLAALGLPAIKHGSYGNTSVVGSTETIELFGAVTSMTTEAQVKKILDQSGFCFFDAHWCKTIHDLSHLLMMETINHVIGPMTPPISPETEINKLMGVNEKIHPETVAKAYTVLHKMGKQRVGGVIVVSGLSEAGLNISPHSRSSVRETAIMDECSPYATVVSASVGERFLGTCKLNPSNFGLLNLEPEKIQVANTKSEIQRANLAAITGADSHLADYLAMNAALGLYAFTDLKQDGGWDAYGPDKVSLRKCFERCREAITSGKAMDVLSRYVEASGGMLKLSF